MKKFFKLNFYGFSGKAVLTVFLWVVLLFSVSCSKPVTVIKPDIGTKPSPSPSPSVKTEETGRENSPDNLIVKEIEIAGNIPAGGIHDAAIKGDIEKLKELAGKESGSVNQRHVMNYGRTPLHYAVIYGHKEAVEFLISKGAEIDLKDVDHGRTALHYAAITGYMDIGEILVSKGTNVNEEDEYGWTPLHHGAINGHTGIIGLLLRKGAKVDAVDEVGKTPLHYAVTYGHNEAAQKLIAAKADVNRKDDEGRTPLHYAVKWKASGDTVLMLLDAGTDLNAKDENGMTPLMMARKSGNSEMERLLLSKGARDESMAEGSMVPAVIKGVETSGDEAVEKKDLSVLEQAIMNGERGETLARQIDGVKEINKKNDMGLTLLHQAVMYGNVEAVEMLAARKADISVRDGSGRTPLHYCAIYGLKDVENVPTKGGACLEIARFLLGKGVDVNAGDADRREPLHHVRSRVMAELFIDKGGDVKSKDKNGWTPLHWAAMQGFLEISKILVEHGADVNALDGDGRTPMDAATIEWRRDEGHSAVAAYLRAHGGVKKAKRDDKEEED